MNKNILVKLVSIAAAFSLLAGATYAYFSSSQVTISNVNIQSATPTLQLYDGVGAWSVGPYDLGFTDTHIYPGWIGPAHTFYLRNNTGGSVPFAKIIPAIIAGATGDWDALKGSMQMQFGEPGVAWTTGWYTLQDWFDGTAAVSANLLNSPPADGTQRQFSVQFQMPSTGGDQSGAQNKNLTFSIGFVAQTP